MADRRAQLLAATVAVMARLGYAQFSMGALAREVGVSKGVVTYHFPHKESLLAVVVQEFYADAARYMGAHMRTEGTSMDALTSYIETNLTFVLTQPVRALAVMDIVANGRRDDGSPLVPADDRVYDTLLEIFDYGQAMDGQFRAFSPRPMAQLVRSAIDAVAGSLARGEHADPPAVIQEVVTAFALATRRTGS